MIDNSDRRLDSDFSEISISRHIDRSGEGVYRLNGARCRLVDVLEVLSDTGLGKEMHSVISQGRVESIVHSKPVDRTALIEEAAGLTKHRKRRHRAQLKLARTQDNLDRALDVEREARSHLRPLKRQAEAAELHARLERQSLEARATLVADDLRDRARGARAGRHAAPPRRRARRATASTPSWQAVARSREEAERALAEHGRERERLAGARVRRALRRRPDLPAARVRRARRRGAARRASSAPSARSCRCASSSSSRATPAPGGSPSSRPSSSGSSTSGPRGSTRSWPGLESERAEAQRRVGGACGATARRPSARARDAPSASVAEARGRRQAADRAVGAGRPRARRRRRAPRGGARARPAGAAGRRRRVARRAARRRARLRGRGLRGARRAAARARRGEPVRRRERACPALGAEGGRALVRRALGATEPATRRPCAGAERLLDRVRPAAEVADLVGALLGAAWIVERHRGPARRTSRGIAVTRDGLAYESRARRGAPAAARRRRPRPRGAQPARRPRGRARRAWRASSSRRAQGAREADRRAAARRGARATRPRRRLRDVRREQQQAEEEERRLSWLVDQRREHATGPDDARRAQVTAELAAERRVADRLEHERRERVARVEALERSLEQDRDLLPHAERLAAVAARRARPRRRRGASGSSGS